MPRGHSMHPVPPNRRSDQSPASRRVGGSLAVAAQPAPVLNTSFGIPAQKNDAIFAPPNWATSARARSLPHFSSGVSPSRMDRGYFGQNAPSRDSSLTNTPSVHYRQLPATPLQMLQRNVQQLANPTNIPLAPSFAVGAPSPTRGSFQQLSNTHAPPFAQQAPSAPLFNSAPLDFSKNNSTNVADPRMPMSYYNSAGSPQNNLSYRRSMDGTPQSTSFRASQRSASHGAHGVPMPNFQFMSDGVSSKAANNFGGVPMANPTEQRSSANQGPPQMGELILEDIQPNGASFSWVSYRDDAPAPVLLIRTSNQEFQVKFHHVEGNVCATKASLPSVEMECSLVDTPMPPLIIPQRKHPERWNVNDVLFFVRTLNIPSILPQITAFHIDGQTLQTLCEKDMAPLGLHAPFLQRRFLDFVDRFFGSPYGPRMSVASSVQSRTSQSPLRSSMQSQNAQFPLRSSMQSHTVQRQHVQPAVRDQAQAQARARAQPQPQPQPQQQAQAQAQAHAQKYAIKQVSTQIGQQTQKPAHARPQVQTNQVHAQQARVQQAQTLEQTRGASPRQLSQGNLNFATGSPRTIAPMNRSFEAGGRLDSPQLHPQMNLQQGHGGRDDTTRTQLGHGQETTSPTRTPIVSHPYIPHSTTDATRAITHTTHSAESSIYQRHQGREQSSVGSGSAPHSQDRVPQPTHLSREGLGNAQTLSEKTHPEHGYHKNSDGSMLAGGELKESRRSAMSNAVRISSANFAVESPSERRLSVQPPRSTIGDGAKRNSAATDRRFIVSCRGRIGA